MTTFKNLLLVGTFAVATITACEKESADTSIKKTETPPATNQSTDTSQTKKNTGNSVIVGYSKGVYISCEGNFQKNNGTISYFNPDSSKVVNDVFGVSNLVDTKAGTTGDVVQSFGVAGKYGVVVANNSGKVAIVNLVTFKQTGELAINYPRYFVAVDSTKGFVSAGSTTGEIVVINPKTATKITSIKVGNGPEHLVIKGGSLIVANSGGWDKDSTLSVIDIATNAVTQTIQVGALQPTNLTVDANGDIWVICKGYTQYNADYSKVISESDSKLVKISGTNFSILKSWTLGVKGDFFTPVNIDKSPDGKIIYYAEIGGIYAFSINAKELPNNLLVANGDQVIKQLYGFSINPKNNDIYCFDAIDSKQNGKMVIYNSAGVVQKDYIVGLLPNGAVFN